jgi:hypothetical protein
MSISNPVNLAPALAAQTSLLNTGLNANKTDIAAALSALLTEHTTGQTALASSLADILAKIALESDQNETLINALSTVNGDIDSSVNAIDGLITTAKNEVLAKPTSKIVFPVVGFQRGQVYIKANQSTIYNSEQSNFYSFISGGTDESKKGFGGAVLADAYCTTKKTIVDIEGNGVLTHLISGNILNSPTTVTFTVTADGKEYIITKEGNATNFRVGAGDFRYFYPVNTASAVAGLGMYTDKGFNNTAGMYMPIPLVTATEGVVGIPFKTSLKVEVIASDYFNTAAIERNSSALYTLNTGELV